MKKVFTKIFALILAISLSTIAFGQNITTVSVSANPNDCSNTSISVLALQLCINYNYLGITHSINGNVINVDMNWATPGPICLGALAQVTDVSNLGQAPAGTYTLNVNGYLDGVLQNTNSQSLTIVSCCPVNAVATQNATNICVGESGFMVDASTGATSTHWSQNGTTVSSADTLFIPFTAPGTYSYHLVATNGSCTDSTLYSLKINAYPTVNLGADTTACVGQPIIINGSNPIPGVTYSWSTGATNPSISINNPGTYTLTVSNNGCTGSDAITVTATPTPTFNLGADVVICQGNSVTLNATVNQTGVTYSWSNGATTPTISVTTSGTYSATATNSSNCSFTDNVFYSGRSNTFAKYWSRYNTLCRTNINIKRFRPSCG